MALYCCDLESTGLLDDLKKQENPLLHNFEAMCPKTGEYVRFSRSDSSLGKLQEWLNEGHTLVIHNGIGYDGEALKLFGYDISNNEIIDTLGLSWYLYPKLALHGLAAWGEVFGVPKPLVDDWEGLTPEEYDNRVHEDCKIQVEVWNHFNTLLNNLYGTFEGKKRLIDYINWKMELQRIQQIYRWTLDKPAAIKLLARLEEEQQERLEALEKAMPDVPIYAKRTRPAKPFLKSGALSVTGARWDELTKEHGLSFDYSGEIKVVTGYNPPNGNSHAQIKNWLFSLGWVPETFDFKRNKETGETRQIPQTGHKDGGGMLCDSVQRIIDKNPGLGIDNLAGLGIISHRKGLVNGMLREVGEDGKILARCNGFTNTLRLKHAGLVNLPSTRVPYGKEIRGLLGTPEGYKNIGSDLASLEDRCKHHFQWKFDPEYVKAQMADDYDPHLAVCVMGGLLNEKQVQAHKDKLEDHSGTRHLGKGGNYALMMAHIKDIEFRETLEQTTLSEAYK